LKASELVKILNELIEKHGDHDVFSVAEYEYVSGAKFKTNKYRFRHDEPEGITAIVIEGNLEEQWQ
jgi:hypothetical protein